MQPPDSMDQPAGEKPLRLPALDLIRGIAVLGILPVNITVFSGIGFYLPAEGDHWSNVLAAHAVTFLFEGKMVTLLSMLFGVGLAMQAGQAQAAGQRFAPYGRRRMTVLFLLGLAHALLLFQFDILTSYAVSGFIALLFIQRHERVLRRVAAVCFTWSFGLMLVLTAAVVLITLWIGPLEDASGSRDKPASATVSDSEEPFAAQTLWLEKFFDEEYETRVFLEGTLGEMVPSSWVLSWR